MPISTKNKKAARRILNALRDLTLTKNAPGAKTASQKAALRDAIKALEVEYLDVTRRNPDATYSDIANRLNGARNDLEKIAMDRQQLKSTLVSAAKLLGSVNSLLALVI